MEIICHPNSDPLCEKVREGVSQLVGQEVFDMSRIARVFLLVELSAIVSVDEKPQSTNQGIRATRETTRFTSQSRQIMA